VSQPADVLDLRNWKLTLPIQPDEHVETKKNGDAYEVFQPALATFADKRCFSVTDDGKGVVLTVHHGDLATQGSENPRCELREMTNNGKDEHNWDGTAGTHTLTVEGQVNRVTTKTKTVVLAQVHNKRDHGKSDDVTVFRLVGDKLHITEGDDDDAFIVPGDFPLNTRYTLKIEVKDGRTSYWVNGKKQDFTTKNKDRKNYFKAGNYLQSHGDGPAEKLAEVVLYSVTVSHS